MTKLDTLPSAQTSLGMCQMRTINVSIASEIHAFPVKRVSSGGSGSRARWSGRFYAFGKRTSAVAGHEPLALEVFASCAGELIDRSRVSQP